MRSTRLVSFTQRAILAVHYEVEAVGDSARIVVQSELVANESVPAASADPRVAAALEKPLEAEEHSASDDRSLLMHRTRASALRMAVAADHRHRRQRQTRPSHTYVEPDWARTTIGTTLDPGERLTLTKFVSYGWSGQRSAPALRDQVDAALSAAVHTGWDGLVAEQRPTWTSSGTAPTSRSRATRPSSRRCGSGSSTCLQAGARAEQRPIAAKGLTGTGYDGHAFWDTETYVLPVLIATAPQAAADALHWRHSTLDLAIERAEHAQPARGGVSVADDPRAGMRRLLAGRHRGVSRQRRYRAGGRPLCAIGPAIDDFDRDCALPMLVQTARLWMSLGYFGDR